MRSQLQTGAGPTTAARAGAWRVCTTRSNLRRTAAIALCVGACLVAINQFQPLLHGPRPLSVWVRVGLDFVVPFVVSNLGVLSEALRRHPGAATAPVGPPGVAAGSRPQGRLDSGRGAFYSRVEGVDHGVDETPVGAREKST